MLSDNWEEMGDSAPPRNINQKLRVQISNKKHKPKAESSNFKSLFDKYYILYS
jgi:hypothetical protein